MEQHELQCVFLAGPIPNCQYIPTLNVHLYSYFITECFLRTFDLTCLVLHSYYIIHIVSSELPFPRIPVDGFLIICLLVHFDAWVNIIWAFTPCLCPSDMPLYLGVFPFWHEELSWTYLGLFFIVFRKSLKPCHLCPELGHLN